MEIKELADLLQKNGVVGAGGAGFPTYASWINGRKQF